VSGLQILVLMAMPAAVLVVGMIKLERVWLPVLRKLPLWQRVGAAAALGALVAWGGSKPGPSKENLRLLMAQREGRLSSGGVYAPKEGLYAAVEQAGAARADSAVALEDVMEAAGALAAAGAEAETICNAQRHYIRLEAPQREPDGTFYAELVRVSVARGAATAAVWFSLVPESEPKLLFNFASAPAKGVWGRSAPFASSFPDTFPVLGRDCYMYYFDVPQELLDEEGALESALQVEREIALGNATAGFNLLGALALQHEGRLFLAVTGFVTNSVTGEVLYFDSGRLADPPERTTSGEEVL
jgi:hypothetical protein